MHPFFFTDTGHSFGTTLMFNFSNNVLLQLSVPFKGFIDLLLKPLKPNFGVWIGIFKLNVQKKIKISYYVNY